MVPCTFRCPARSCSAGTLAGTDAAAGSVGGCAAASPAFPALVSLLELLLSILRDARASTNVVASAQEVIADPSGATTVLGIAVIASPLWVGASVVGVEYRDVGPHHVFPGLGILEYSQHNMTQTKESKWIRNSKQHYKV